MLRPLVNFIFKMRKFKGWRKHFFPEAFIQGLRVIASWTSL